MRLDLARRARVRAATRAPDLDPSELGGELNIVPFLDIVTNVIMFLLATAFVAMAVAQVPTRLGGLTPGAHPHDATLSVTLVRGGAVVATGDGKLGADCEHFASGRTLTVGVRAGETDWRALDACLAHVKSRMPEQTQVALGADPDVPYADVVHAMDVARGDGTRFPDVLLSAGVR